MHIVYILLTVLLTISCGSAQTFDSRYLDERLAPYVRDFSSHFFQPDFPIVFEELEGDHAGICYVMNSGRKRVVLDETGWKRMSFRTRSQLVWHELSHCALGLGHDSGTIELDGIMVPKSIMHPYVFSERAGEIYWNNKDYYVKEIKEKYLARKNNYKTKK